MFQSACRKLGSVSCNLHKASIYGSLIHATRPLQIAFARTFTDGVKDINADNKPQFDISLLEFLVCPLSKKALRYDETTNELVNDELGIAYPVIGGIPNMVPQDARMIRKDSEEKENQTKE
ncbi:protein preY, mitochondrial-like [Anguilla anguilla]|uniref:protein preY, mitochondrial-like n=1 Tax=Anguilla anguilla TaxID=7936 RepID=UPI0015AFBFEA|nr:protein preY, mitochondrial-like [Anguilla anguilla]